MGDAAKDFELPEGGCEGLVFSKDGGSDGMNTEGLAIHMLYLGEEVSRVLIGLDSARNGIVSQDDEKGWHGLRRAE